MFDLIIETDIKIFKYINITLHNEFLAWLMKFTANDIFLAAVIFTGLFFLLKRGGTRERINTAFGLWALIITNIINSSILKAVFKRPRPVIGVEGMYFLVRMRHINYAFPSTHTAMAAALAVVLWEDYKKLRPVLLFFVFSVGFFCVYTGGHYPLDVLAGVVVGLVTGIIINIFKKKIKARYGSKRI